MRTGNNIRRKNNAKYLLLIKKGMRKVIRFAPRLLKHCSKTSQKTLCGLIKDRTKKLVAQFKHTKKNNDVKFKLQFFET